MHKEELEAMVLRSSESIAKMTLDIKALKDANYAVQKSFEIVVENLEAKVGALKTLLNVPDDKFKDEFAKSLAQFMQLKEDIEDAKDKVEDSKEAAMIGNIVIVAFRGFISGAEFQGGRSDYFRYRIGTNQVLDALESSFVGKKAGDAYEVTTNFPADYHKAELACKEVTFQVKVLKVKKRKQMN